MENISVDNVSLSSGLIKNPLFKNAVNSLIHEISNPLDGVSRYVNLALENIKEETIEKKYLREARLGLCEIVKTMRFFLDFYPAHSEEEKIDIHDEIENSLNFFSQYIKSAGIKIEKNFALFLPKVVDYRLRSAFINIIKNACQAMRGGGLLSISTAMRDTFIEIRFKDNGPGIPAQIQDKIFAPFFTTKNSLEGSGIGLFISREVIMRYNGKIFVESNLGEGTTFVIQLLAS